jgi:glycopeptide antibiotics resistance protein
MSNWGIRRVALALLALYVGAGLTVVLWPTRVDTTLHGDLLTTLAAWHANGVPTFVNYAFIESGSNVLMFLPLGVLVTLIASARHSWIAPVVGFTASGAAELAQLLFLPNRVATIEDVVANTAGALIGTLLVVIARRAARSGRALRPVVALRPVLRSETAALEPQHAEAQAA